MNIDISTGEMRSGAQSLRVTADNIRACAQAADAALSSNAFGLLCSPLLLPMYGIFEQGTQMWMQQIAKTQDKLCEGVEHSADSLDQTDDALGRTFDRVPVQA